MSKKGYPGLVLVPPSDRTIVRRRIVRWSVVSIAVVWGLFTFISSLAPSGKSNCQSVDLPTPASTTQADCNPATASVPESPPRREEPPSTTESSPNVNPTEGQSPLASPESTKPVSEQTTDLLVTANPPEARTTADDHPAAAQPDGSPIADPSPNQPTRPTIVTDHKSVAQESSGTTLQHPIPPAHAASDHKPTTQPGNGSAATSGSHPPVKSVSSTAEHKVVTQTPKEPATPPISTQPTKTATPASPDQKLTGHAENGGNPKLTHTKPVAPSTHTASDHKLPAQPGNGVSQSQTSQPAKLVNTPDHKQTVQPHNGSVLLQTSPQAVAPKPSAPDRKVSPQLGNGSVQHPHPTGTAHAGAGQSGNGTAANQVPSSDSSQDTRLAEEGDAFAQYRLGRFYAQQGGRQTPEAAKWYKRAATGLRRLAEAGNGQAMYILGVMYAYGRGVSQNTHEARLWLSQAIERKVSAARPVLASLEKDRSIAHSTR